MNATRAARHGVTLGWRNIAKFRHTPDQLLDILLMPITFVVMFVFLFGNAVSGDWHAYLRFVIPGIAVQALMFAMLGGALALNADMREGIHDRFRSLPIARSAPLVGHILGDCLKYVLSVVLVFAFGAALGFRFGGGALAVAGAAGLLMAFALATCWIGVLIGVAARNAETVQALSLVLIFPLTFGSNVFVPAEKLPGWLQAWVRINPVSQVTDAVRALTLGLPAGGSVPASLLWSAGIAAVFAPAAVLLYRRRG
ncbi:ABC transporter permease [Planotetraspora kaengkrachanensis]|uniref:Transport permease protein n=1 Tax=Planotetraspora kaengkrachanensis TaxID=575193 RepID=A0A8J3LY71_9ACTN|nr:ABC transporter permease [Planotetraspora kaengkrachanensis]GIG80752.1 transport permease protein [Planotetraspora kaengkrachanensis]